MKKYIGKNIKALNIVMIMACIGSSTVDANAWVDTSHPALTNHELLKNIAYLLGISYTDAGVLTPTNTINSTYEQIQAAQNNVDSNLRLVQNTITGATGNPEIGSLGTTVVPSDGPPTSIKGKSILLSQNETSYLINDQNVNIMNSINSSNENIMNSIDDLDGTINNNLQQVQNTITGASPDTRIGSLGLETPQTKKGQSIAGIQGTNTGDTLTSIAGEIAAVKTDVGTVKTELKADIDAAKTDVRADVDAAKTDVRSDIAGLKIDVDTVKGALTDTTAGSIRDDLTTVKTDVGTVKADVGTVKADVETVKTTAGDVKSALTDTASGSIRDDLTTVKSDVGTVKADVETVKTTSGDVKSALTDTAAGSIRDDLTTVKTDVGTVKADVETVKTTAGDVKSALTSTDAGSIRDHLTTVKTDVGTVKADVETVKTTAGDVKTALTSTDAGSIRDHLTTINDSTKVGGTLQSTMDSYQSSTDSTLSGIVASIGSPTMATMPGTDGATILGSQTTMASDAATASKKFDGNLNTIKRTTDKTAKSIANSTKKGLSSSNPKGPIGKVTSSKKNNKNTRKRS
jgi:hypothetical protein